MTKEEKAMLYDALLSTPCMKDQVKLNGSLSRKLLLLMSQVILKALKEKENELFVFYPAEAQNELRTFIEECLNKIGLLEVNMKLNQIK